MNYVLRTTGVLPATAMMLSGCQGSSEKYTFRDVGTEQLNAGSYGEVIQSFDNALGESGGLMRAFEVDVLEYRAGAEYKVEDYMTIAHTYKMLSQVDEAWPEYMDRQNTLYTKAGELDEAMEAYQAAYGPDTGKDETDGKSGGDSASNKNGRNDKKDADKEDSTDDGDVNNGADSAGGGDTAAVSGQVAILLSLGQALAEVERFDDTKTLCQQAIDDDIRSDGPYNYARLCKMETEDLDMALFHFNADIQLPDESTKQKILYSRVAIYGQEQGFATVLELLGTYAATYGGMPEVNREIIFLKSYQQ